MKTSHRDATGLSLHVESFLATLAFVALVALLIWGAALLERVYPCRTADDAPGESRPTSCLYDDTNPSTSRSPQ